MKKFIEGLRTALDNALLDIDGFMGLVAKAVTTNAPAIVKQYDDLGLELNSAIIDPWNAAAEKIKSFGGADGLGVMNSWVTEGGAIYDFDTKATDLLQSPWEAGKTAIDTFKGAVVTAMSGVVDNVNTNVVKAKEDLESLYEDIIATEKKAQETNFKKKEDTPKQEDPPKTEAPKSTKYLTVDTLVVDTTQYIDSAGKVYYKTKGSSDRYVDKSSTYKKDNGLYAIEGSYYYNKSELSGLKTYSTKLSDGSYHVSGSGGRYSMYASGTMGTNRDELAITDESWIGEEITLAAGKNGQLQYLKKGSAVMPADISANLVEWGKLNPNMMNMGGAPNLNMISNAVNKPEFNMSFDSLVHVDHCDEGTLKDLEKMVDTKINQFSKQMNYAIKKIGGR